jgi:hypothetical protein
MEKGIRMAVVLIGLIALLGGLGFIFAPIQMEAEFSIVASRIDGMGTIRGDLGGMFLMVACFTLYGSRPGKSQWLVVPLVLLITVLFGRSVHILIDGISQPAIRSTVIEIVALVFLNFARRRLAVGQAVRVEV